MDRSESDYTDQGTLAALRGILEELDGAGSHRWDTAEVSATERLLVGRVR
ncbi:MAG TPA: hypothetical protein VMM60_15050 [Ilumatobacter sp.]|nr:hypothetical protein [Ilumatobacter sp.]